MINNFNKLPLRLLSVRSTNALASNGIHTVGDLANVPREKMYLFRNIGRRSLEEINALRDMFGV